MFVHIWRMKCRKKKAAEYEKFGRQVTLAALKKIDGCQDAQFIRVFESRKPEYLWLVYWRDKEALESARTNPAWRDQIKRFEAGNFYKTIPLELVCESLGSFGEASVEKLKKAEQGQKTGKRGKATKTEKRAKLEPPEKADNGEKSEDSGKTLTAPLAEGE